MLEVEKLRNWVANRSGLLADQVSDQCPIFSSGLLDSFDLIELVVFVEQATGRRIKPMDIDIRHFDTLQRIHAFVKSDCKPAA
jgi:acyl carrier protein